MLVTFGLPVGSGPFNKVCESRATGHHVPSLEGPREDPVFLLSADDPDDPGIPAPPSEHPPARVPRRHVGAGLEFTSAMPIGIIVEDRCARLIGGSLTSRASAKGFTKTWRG